ncbi:MAG TPA: nucleotidyltransferase domain-containing protein [Thermomicrobiales bacterium]|jgi:predicted nucleotidyltransferase|nr:nucleotidyltransferase domain-containing protein [Thermomicrobiales bacterium]
MHPLIADHLDAIRDLCREFGVARLEVFGSVMTDRFNDESDVDFIVHYPEGYEFGPWLGRHFELQERLAMLLPRKVDLVMPSVLRNKWFRREAEKTRTVLYDASHVPEVAR